jgi:peptidyl-prolyl cis-trans isomerase C
MKTSRTALAALLAASLSLAAPLVSAQNIAVVNGKAVPKARVDAMIDQILKSPQQPGQPPMTRTPDLEQKVKDEIVLREIYIQEAERLGLQRSSDYKTQMEFARQSILIRALFTVAQIKAGAKFEDLAKKNSKDPGSAENGGDLDWANPGNYVPEFSAAMTKLQKGQVTETAVKSQFGFHIIKLEDVRAVQFPTFEEVKEQIVQRQNQVKVTKYREDLKKKAKTDYTFSNGN